MCERASREHTLVVNNTIAEILRLLMCQESVQTTIPEPSIPLY